MGPGDRWPREGRTFRRHHSRERSNLRANWRRFHFFRRHHTFRARNGYQFPIGKRMGVAAMSGHAIRYLDTVSSTMDLAAGEPLGTVIVANAQTAGQGRHGHSWHSEPDSGIYCSIVLKPKPLLTLALGLATAEAVTKTTGIACDLRWPNDVLLDDKKVAGILVKLADELAIGGIGINVNHTSFPAELSAEATSLRLHAGRQFAREEILQALLALVDIFSEMDCEAIL